MPGRATAWGGILFGAALALRLFVSFRTALPSVDGVIFLSMAKDMAAGEWARALERVFHPLFPLLVSPLVQLGLEPFPSASVLLSIFGAAGAALVLPLALELGASRGAALAVAALAAASVWAVRYTGDAYSEPLFAFFAALAALLHLRQAGNEGKHPRLQGFLAGFISGLAFTTRPEGAALAGALVLAGPRRLLRALGAALPALAYLGARWALLGALGPTPKLGFMLPMGPLGAPSLGEGVLLYLGNLGKAFLLGFESLDALGWILALAGVFLVLGGRGRKVHPGAKALLLALLLALLGMSAFQVKRRFLVDWAPVLLAFGALAWDAFPRKGRPFLTALLVLALAWNLCRLFPPRKFEKTGEVVVARWIAGKLRGGERIVTDMPRIAYYAGLRPPPPRVPGREEIARECSDPRVRFLVLGSKRPLLREFGPPPSWVQVRLPPRVERAARERGVSVFTRRRR